MMVMTKPYLVMLIVMAIILIVILFLFLLIIIIIAVVIIIIIMKGEVRLREKLAAMLRSSDAGTLEM